MIGGGESGDSTAQGSNVCAEDHTPHVTLMASGGSGAD